MNHTPSTIHHTTRPPLIASSDPTRFAAERSRDFVRLCRLIFRRSRVAMSQREIIGAALAHEAPGYYVDYDYALRVVGKVMAMPPATVARYGRGKWLEIATRCRAELEAGRADTLSGALALVLSAGRASSFFISPATALRILQRANTRDCRRP
ncbi:MAG: hypothetical protein HFJ93_03325 [Muribaculaceae bacterium]|nr:hypothetical protein [Muribaculaceae bacterium]